MRSPDKEVTFSERGIGTRVYGISTKAGGKKAFAKKLGLSESQLYRYINDEQEMKITTALKMSQIAGVSLDWLITGDGDPYEQEKTSGEPSHDEYAFIPGYNIQVSAGNGKLASEGEKPTRRLAFRHRWLKYRGLNEKDLVLVFADGDSMEPTISDNNTLMVDTSQDQPKDGGIYVIRHGENLVVKRTQLIFGEGVRLISDNKAYPEQMVDFDAATDLQVVGRVVWIGKDV